MARLGPTSMKRVGGAALALEPPDNHSGVPIPPVNKLLCLREHDNSRPRHPALSVLGRAAIIVLTNSDMACKGYTFPKAVYNFCKLSPTLPSPGLGFQVPSLSPHL